MRPLFLDLVVLAALAAPTAAQTPALRPVPVARAEAAPPRAIAVNPAVPQPQSGGADQTLATLRSGDTFEMRLSGMEAPYGEEFMRVYTVDPDGSVNFPYIKDVRAAGYTPGQLERVIQQRLVAAKIFTNPTVNITLQTTARVVAVTGGVRQPQRLQWTPDLTLRTAVDLAGGIGEFSSPKAVKHIRGGKILNIYDLRKLQKDPSADPKVLPGDQVDVPQ